MASLKVVLDCLEALLVESRNGVEDLGPDSQSRVVLAFRQAFAVFMFVLLGHRYAPCSLLVTPVPSH